MSALRAILKLAGKGESKVAAVFGTTPDSCHRAVVHLRAGAPELPVWLFAIDEPAPETVALCKLVLVRSSSLQLALDAYRMLWPFWVALSVVPWLGGHGRWPLKLAAFLIPPFRVLIQNRSGDFLAGTPAGILSHAGRLVRDAADNMWNTLRTAWHWLGDIGRDIGNWFSGGALNLRLLGLLAVGTLLRWLGYPHCRLFPRLHGNHELPVDLTARIGDAAAHGVLRFEAAGPRWDGDRLERAVRASSAKWILWGAGDVPPALPFDDPQTFAVSRQPHFRAWKPMMLFTAPFRTLQGGEFSRVMAPLAGTILVDREKLLALGIPRTALAVTAWMLIFWKAAAAGWHSYSAGQDHPLKEQPDFPMQETAFLLKLFGDPGLRRLGPREPDLARGCIAFARGAGDRFVSPVLFEPGRRRPTGDSSKLKVLLVTPFLPYPLAHGGAVRIHNLCRTLADRVDFSLVALREKHDAVDYEKLHQIFRDVRVVDIDERASTDTRLPVQVRGHQSRAMRALIADIAHRWRPDLLQLEYTHMAAFRHAAPGVPAILVEHDLTFTLYRQFAASNPSREADAEYRRWLSFEQHWLRTFDGVWTVSDEDRQTVLREAGRDAGETFSVPNGVDIHRFTPQDEPTEVPEILYVGSFRHLPNILGFEKLQREVMPRIWKRFPGVRLRVVAGPRHQDYWKESGTTTDSRVEIHGFVEDLRPLYALATLVAVPLGVSAGTNIKVLEAMACGKPVVSTAVGCAGLGLMDGKEVVIRDSWSEFADAASALLSDPDARRRIAAAARRTAEQHFSWDAIADAAFDSYDTLVKTKYRKTVIPSSV